MPSRLKSERSSSDPQRKRMAQHRSGQYTFEWTLLMSAAVIAAVLMSGYVRNALRAGVKTTEMQLNGAMNDNRP